MWKQQRKRMARNKVQQFFSWLKAIVSLVFVMSLTWILGLVGDLRPDLTPVVYIHNIAVAFQGFFIFLVLVVLVSSVRKNIKSWFKTKVKKWRENLNFTKVVS